MLTNPTTAVRYTLTPGVSSFSITFGYWDKSQILVLLTEANGDLITLTLGTDYTLSNPDGVSGTLTKVSDWGDATKLTIMRAVPVTQERDLINGQVLDAQEIEQAFDKATAILQEHKEKLSRAVLFSEDEEGSNITLPGKVKRQGTGYGTILGFDGSGDVAIVRDLKTFDDDVAAAIAAAAAASASETNAANSATKAGKWAEEAENIPVETGKYSAKHHAAKAKGSATDANNAKTAAQTAQGAAETARDKAKKWADEEEDTPVETGKYSAKHHAEKASDSATAAATSETNAGTHEDKAKKWAEEAENVQVETGKFSAKHHSAKAASSAAAASTSKDQAAESEAKAEKWAEEDEDTPVEAGKYSAKHYAKKAKDSADNASTSETNAGNSETAAGNSAAAAAQSNEDAEAWATGKRNGVDVEPTDPTYHNNSKYFSDITNPDIKADKVVGATNGNLAELDGNGNLKDSGIDKNNVLQKTGGTMTGGLETQAVYPDTGNSRMLGAEDKPYLGISVKHLYMGGKQCEPIGLHNGIYRGACLYDAVNYSAGVFTSISAIHNAVSTGDFSNIYIGDYILIKITTSYKSNETVKMVVAGIDTYLHKGDTELTSHHLTLIPEEAFETTASMNGSHTTEGGYAGSAMHTTVLPIYATALNSALGGYMLTFRDLLSKTVNTSAASGAYSAWSGASSDWAWYSINIRLLSEVQVYGTRVLSSSMFDVGAANVQLPYFLLRPDKLVAHQGYGSSSRCDWWLSAVSDSAGFCRVYTHGNANDTGAGNSLGVRPLILFG